MSALLDLIDLDAPAATFGYNGCRELIWTIVGPAELHRNAFERAWIEVTEGEPMKGEPLWDRAYRRTDPRSMRERFTDRAQKLIHGELIPKIARDFGERWERAHMPAASPESFREAAEAERTRVRWYERAAELTEMYSMGLLQVRPPEIPDRFTCLANQVRILRQYDRGSGTTDRAGDCYLDGELVGYLTRLGVVPV